MPDDSSNVASSCASLKPRMNDNVDAELVQSIRSVSKRLSRLTMSLVGKCLRYRIAAKLRLFVSFSH